MSTEIPILYNELKGDFDRAISEAREGEYVERPKALSILAKKRREFIETSRENNRLALDKLRIQAQEISNEYSISEFEAKALIISAWTTQERLFKEGAVFNDKPFNFALSRIEMTQNEKKFIEDSSLTIMDNLRKLGQNDLRTQFPFLPLNSVEEMFESLKLLPNAGRLDFLLTDKGPKLIEINSQWVDAIAALQGFQEVFGQKGDPRPIETLSGEFFFRKRVAIININQSKSSSKTSGAAQELGVLAKKLKTTRKPPSECEVIDPEKISLEYLNRFDIYYLNCDPRYFALNTPAWIKNIYQRVAKGNAAIFPSWRPLLDKKIILSKLSLPIVVPTVLLTVDFDGKAPAVIKGDGYSLNSVIASTDPNFKNLLPYALEDANSYVVQPYVEGLRVDSWVYDTSREKIKFLKNAYTKLNVWVLGDKVVGMLATLSDSPLISDKGFNTIPLVRKDQK